MLQLHTCCNYTHAATTHMLQLHTCCNYTRAATADVLQLHTFCNYAPTLFATPAKEPKTCAPLELKSTGESVRTITVCTVYWGVYWVVYWGVFSCLYWGVRNNRCLSVLRCQLKHSVENPKYSSTSNDEILLKQNIHDVWVLGYPLKHVDLLARGRLIANLGLMNSKMLKYIFIRRLDTLGRGHVM